MNDKCCKNCIKSGTPECVLYNVLYESYKWAWDQDSCSRYSPLPDKPGRIEPITIVDTLQPDEYLLREIVAVVNQLVAAHNGRDGK